MPVIKTPILITGATGFIGANLVRKLVALNAPASILIRQQSDTWRIADILDKVSIELADLTNKTEVKKVIEKVKPKTVFHLATYGGYPFQDDSQKIFNNNINGTLNLLQACQNLELVAFINTGSSSEYGKKIKAMSESDNLEPNSFYGIAKVAQTNLCCHYGKNYSLPVTTIRPFSVYGPYEEPTRLVPTLIRRALEGNDLELADANIARDFIYIDDLVELYLLAASNPYVGEIFNAGSGKQSTLLEVANLVVQNTNSNVKIKYNQNLGRTYDTDKWFADINKTVAYYGWQPKTALKDGIAKTVDWFKSGPTEIKSKYKFEPKKKSDFKIRTAISELVSRCWPITSMKGLNHQEFIAGQSPVQYSGPSWDEAEITESIFTLLRGNWLSAGEKVAEFEREFSATVGRRYGVMCNSGSSANLLMLSALKSKRTFNFENIEVITPVVCFPTTVAPIIQNGFTPKFVDVEMDTLNLNLDEVEKAITSKTKAIIFAHVLGNPPDMDRLMQICAHHNLILLEDACDSLGSNWSGRPLGSFGLMSSFSFYPAHHITTGEGGMVCTDDKPLSEVLRSMCFWGRACHCVGSENLSLEGNCKNRFGQWLKPNYSGIVDHKYVYDEIGYNLKPLELQGAIGLVQLKKLPELIAARKKIFNRFYEVSSKYSSLIKSVKIDPRANVSWFGFPITVVTEKFSRADLVNFLESNKIQTRNYFSGNILFHRPYFHLGNPYNYPNAVKVMERTFFIGVQPRMSEAMINYVSEKLDKFFSQYA